MCLILLSYRRHDEFPLIIAANRDEFYDRPSVPARYWPDYPQILGGRDIQGGGTWMGLSEQGRAAMITNYREPGAFNPDAPTRGKLVSDFLSGDTAAINYLEELKATAQKYNGFNLMLSDVSGWYYYSNRMEPIIKLQPGVFGLSNHLLDTPWPKITRSKEAFIKLHEQAINETDLLNVLADETRADEALLPDTGVGTELEKMLSPVFIKSSKYGTRCSTVVLIDKNRRARFIEKTFDPFKAQWSEVRFSFTWNGYL